MVERRVAVIGVLGEDVVEGDGLQVAAVDEVDQLGVAVGDGGQVGVGEHDLLWLKILGRRWSRCRIGSPGRQSRRSPPHRVIVV